MRKLLLLPLVLLGMVACSDAQETAFTQQALNAKMTSLEGKELTFSEILNKYKGKVVVIDVWASWCSDCIKGMDKVHALQHEYKDLVYLFLSYDKSDESWKQGIMKYHVTGEHYHVGTNMKKGDFSEAIRLDWIPRYIVVDKTGKIALFKAIEADDEKLIATIKRLK